MIDEVGPDFEAISQGGPLIGYGNGFLAVRTVKLYADGALGSRGAAGHTALQGTEPGRLLEPGKYDDFILVDQDIFSVEPQKLWRTQVLQHLRAIAARVAGNRHRLRHPRARP